MEKPLKMHQPRSPQKKDNHVVEPRLSQVFSEAPNTLIRIANLPVITCPFYFLFCLSWRIIGPMWIIIMNPIKEAFVLYFCQPLEKVMIDFFRISFCRYGLLKSLFHLAKILELNLNITVCLETLSQTITGVQNIGTNKGTGFKTIFIKNLR